MRTAVIVTGLCLSAAGPSAAAEVVACPAFKSAWASALAKAELSRAAPGFAARGRDGTEALTGVAGLEATLTCREGSLGHLELRSGSPSDPARFDKAVATVLAALDREVPLDGAIGLAAALRGETGGGTRKAVSNWGPYEITLDRTSDRLRDELVVDLAEN